MDLLSAGNLPAGVVSTIPGTSDLVAAVSAALATAPQGVVVVDVREKILAANDSAHSMFGYEPGQLVGQTLDVLLPTSAGPQGDLLSTLWRRAEGRVAASQGPVVAVRKDGTSVPIEVGAGLLAEGHTYYIVANLIDISGRLDLEARLQATSNEQLGFQRLIADIASRLVLVAPNDVDSVLNDSLREVGEALQMDRAVVWQAGRGAAEATATHYWVASHASAPEPCLTADLPWVFSNVEAGEPCWFTRVAEIPDPIDGETLRRQGLASLIVFPLTLHANGHRGLGALEFATTTQEREWVPAVRERLRLVAGVISQSLARKGSQAALDEALQEIRHLQDRLADGGGRGSDESVEIRRDVKVLRSSRPVVSESSMIKRALAQVEQVAPTPATVLLLGETGAGKEVFAQAIHDLSPRHHRHMVRVSCAAIPPALIESELFGRERGAYTGALSRQIGRFEAANQSTLFLDEIGELPLEVQVKLLRVLQERVIERLGSTQQLKVDVRIIAATNRNLEQAVTDGTFREDLFYRLNVFPIVVPPLRERIEDVPGLVWAFIDEFSSLFGKRIESVSKDSLRELQSYSWPGNVRELRNVIERAVILATGPHLAVQAPKPSVRAAQTAQTLEALEIRHIRSVLESTNWRVRGRGGAAERLGLKPTTLESRMARLGITRKKAS
jgi:PAS domain S-box-containing protein